MRRPTGVHAHGFVTINGQKMSKSRGTFITARRYLDSFAPEYLRYYYAAKLGAGIDDLDLNLDEFTTRLNSDIVGKLVNIASRCAGFISRNAGGKLSEQLPDPELFAAFAQAGEAIAAAYEARDYATAIRDIMALADRANQYIDQRKPWTLVKQPTQADAVRGICTQGLNLFRTLMIYLKPVLPAMAEKAERFFVESPWRDWALRSRPMKRSPCASIRRPWPPWSAPRVTRPRRRRPHRAPPHGLPLLRRRQRPKPRLRRRPRRFRSMNSRASICVWQGFSAPASSRGRTSS